MQQNDQNELYTRWGLTALDIEGCRAWRAHRTNETIEGTKRSIDLMEEEDFMGYNREAFIYHALQSFDVHTEANARELRQHWNKRLKLVKTAPRIIQRAWRAFRARKRAAFAGAVWKYELPNEILASILSY